MNASSVALLGNPNTGKTTLFNRLCGARAKTSNFPGTTTAMRVGRSQVGDRSIDVIDLPGLYSLQGASPEAAIVRDVLRGQPERRPGGVIALVDAANLLRNLVLVGELLTFEEPVIVVVNMVDLAERTGLRLDVKALSGRLGVPVLPMVASKGTGLQALRAELQKFASEGTTQVRPSDLPAAGASVDQFSAWADDVLADVYPGGAPAAALDARVERIDRVLTHPLSGGLVFLVVMGALFWTLFSLAAVPMDLIELTFAYLGNAVSAVLPAGPLRDLLIDGVIGGIAGTVVFLPQICLLFFLISLLEDTGYLARAAFVNDRLFRRFGLPGQAFVPLLTALTQGWAIGWASTPYDTRWATRYPKRAALMAAAGPAGNLSIAFVALALIKVGLASGWFVPPDSVTFERLVAAPDGGQTFAGEILSIFLTLNVLLCAFNLIPLPPLDGASVIGLFIPASATLKMRELSHTPMFQIAGLVIAWQIFPSIVGPLFGLILRAVHPGLAYS